MQTEMKDTQCHPLWQDLRVSDTTIKSQNLIKFTGFQEGRRRKVILQYRISQCLPPKVQSETRLKQIRLAIDSNSKSWFLSEVARHADNGRLHRKWDNKR